ncbi:MAG: peptidylprolyl isomerase [Ignavibacteria bacterium]|nr:peptidylprolyl isomerase [Ignavibacteria bacterium]
MKKFLLLLVAFCSLQTILLAQPMPDSTILSMVAPENFTVKFETSTGNFLLHAHRSWSPLAVDRFFALVSHNFYDSVVIFRVIPNFVAQFGLTNSAAANAAWVQTPVQDEPVKTGNKRGTVSFARAGKDSRTIQLFINLKDNDLLDVSDYIGFPPIAEVVDGWDAIMKFNADYGDDPAMKQGEIAEGGMVYTQKEFPKLDYIIKARIVQDEPVPKKKGKTGKK